MENKLTKMMAVFVVAGLMASGPMVYAQNKGDNTESGKSYKHGEGKEFFKELNLTPEQKEKLKTQREAKKENNKAMREQLKVKMQALHEAIGKPGAKPTDVSGLVAEVNALKGQMFSQSIEGVFAMKEVLTPEQFSKMQGQYKERMSKKHGKMGKEKQVSEKVPSEPAKE